MKKQEHLGTGRKTICNECNRPEPNWFSLSPKFKEIRIRIRDDFLLSVVCYSLFYKGTYNIQIDETCVHFFLFKKGVCIEKRNKIYAYVLASRRVFEKEWGSEWVMAGGDWENLESLSTGLWARFHILTFTSCSCHSWIFPNSKETRKEILRLVYF